MQRFVVAGLGCVLIAAGACAQTFSDESASLLANQALSSGCAMGVADMNGDGLDDLVRLRSASDLQIEYQTAGGGTFTQYNFGNLGQSSEWSMCAADYDRNGFNDIIAGGAYNTLKLLTADATGTSYTSAALPDPQIFLQGSNFADIDNDGNIDFFGCHDDGVSSAYRGDGSSFVYDLGLINAVSTIPSDDSGNYGTTWTDYDGDGDIDLYVAKCRLGVNDPLDGRRVNLLFQNDGNGNYTDVAEAAGLRPLAQSWAADFADIDNDGDLDAVVVNHDMTNMIYENDGTGIFTDITATTGIATELDIPHIGRVIQCKFADFDNDGFVDLLLTGRGTHELFHNDGDKTFSVVPGPFVGSSTTIHSFATGDLNRDGFVDVIAGHGTGYNSPNSGDRDQLFINDGNANNWFVMGLTGVASNINGIGARVELFGAWGVQVREVRAGESYGIFHTFNMHFGIGTATAIDSVVVTWPSGTVDLICGPGINQFMTLVEGSSPGTGCTGGCNIAAINPIQKLYGIKDVTGTDAQMVWSSDANAADYNVRYVTDPLLIPAREGNGIDVCVPAGGTNCDHLGAVAGTDGTTFFYNVLGTCNGNEAAN